MQPDNKTHENSLGSQNDRVVMQNNKTGECTLNTLHFATIQSNALHHSSLIKSNKDSSNHATRQYQPSIPHLHISYS